MEATILKDDEEPPRKRSLIKVVLSWSMKDVLNNNLYKGQVKRIPRTFSSSQEYVESFMAPLIEETRAEFASSFSSLSDAFCCEIKSVRTNQGFDLKKRQLLYVVSVKPCKKKKRSDGEEAFGVGDLIAITNLEPKWYVDLDRPGWPYLVAHVTDVNESKTVIHIESSRPMLFEDHFKESGTSRGIRGKKERDTFYALKLMNLTTNTRIWSALNTNPETGNFRIIENLLRTPFVDTDDCSLCQCEESEESRPDKHDSLVSSDLNESQKAAVSSCLDTKECLHENSVRLIWGPPGTGKTKTVGFLLKTLLEAKCRTLTCAPTNTAVLEVTKRLVEGVSSSSFFDGYGFGDVVLIGNKTRMKIKTLPDLYDVFINHRVKVLDACFSSEYGWSDNLSFMISLLEDPAEPYRLYKKDYLVKSTKDSRDEDQVEKIKRLGRKNVRTSKRESEDQDLSKNKTSRKTKGKEKKGKEKKGKTEKDKKPDLPMTFEEFVRSKFRISVQRLYFCVDNLYIHLPTSCISLNQVKRMFFAADLLNRLENALRCVSDHELIKTFCSAKEKSLELLKSLPSHFRGPEFKLTVCEDREAVIRAFCLKEAFLIFCTVSSSVKLYRAGGQKPFEMLVIDEAAQLKECESAIPLQLPKIRHAILIGDEKQLPAMVQSKISEKADFGRSLYERLALLGHKKLLLKVQHRMNPSISAFPNREFYDNMILDGPNVKLRSYRRTFLEGDMFGSYSFINVPHGKEQLDKKHSTQNMVEVAVVADIVTSLYKEYMRTKKKIKLGVISPYKAQVHAMTDIFGKQYSSDHESDFSVSIRSVDGFQGGEEDIIIISTVRCNMGGSVGFLSNLQRTNVALTRARYCLWIVGCGTTLANSNSVWKKVVIDAKERKCFHNAEDDQSLSQAIVAHLLDFNRIDALVSPGSLLFKTAIWKVRFTEGFWGSMRRYGDDLLRKKAFSLLEKLSNGWRLEEDNKRREGLVDFGSSSLLVESYKVSKNTILVWAVDVEIDHASNHYTQILKVWDILEVEDAPKLADHVNIFYRDFSIDQISRCTHKLTEGDLAVPMRWPVDSKPESLESLWDRLSSLSLR